MKLIAAILIAYFALPATAQTISKCSDSKGATYYSQTGCPTKQKETGVVRYQREQDAPRNYSGTRAQVSDSDYDGNSNVGSQRAVGATMDSNNTRSSLPDIRQSSSRKISRRPHPRVPTIANPDNDIGQPTQVLNPRTGQYIQGIKTAPNQVWDPRTGQYYQTIP